jgi:hypothetical protein
LIVIKLFALIAPYEIIDDEQSRKFAPEKRDENAITMLPGQICESQSHQETCKEVTAIEGDNKL